jgi:hypothetical protein
MTRGYISPVARVACHNDVASSVEGEKGLDGWRARGRTSSGQKRQCHCAGEADARHHSTLLGPMQAA